MGRREPGETARQLGKGEKSWLGMSPGAGIGSKDPVAAGVPLSRAQQLSQARHGLQRDPTLGRAEPGAMLGRAQGGEQPPFPAPWAAWGKEVEEGGWG